MPLAKPIPKIYFVRQPIEHEIRKACVQILNTSTFPLVRNNIPLLTYSRVRRNLNLALE